MQERSVRFAAYLSVLPRWVLGLVAAGVLSDGLFVRGAAGGIGLLVVGGFLGWLASLSWPTASPAGRAARVLAIAAALAGGIVKLLR